MSADGSGAGDVGHGADALGSGDALGADLVARLRRLDSCSVSDALDRLGLAGVVLGIVPLAPGSGPLAGSVVTVRVGPRTDDTPRPHLGASAIMASRPGDVIVIDHRGRLDVSAWGGILSEAAVQRQVAGVIVDGACRDIDDARRLGLALFARAPVPTTARGRIVEQSFNEPIVVAGVAVAPGDLVIADSTGVVFVVRERAEEVVALAEAISAREAAMAEAVRGGASIVEVMHDSRFEEIRPAT